MLSPVTEWQTHCKRCGAELDPSVDACAHCGQATERKLPRDSMPGLFQLPRVNHVAVTILGTAAVFGSTLSFYWPVNGPHPSAARAAAAVGLAFGMGVVTAYLARPTNFYGVGLKFVTFVMCALTCALGPMDGEVFLFMAAAPLFAIVIIVCCFGVGFFKILPRRDHGSKEEAQ